MKYPILILSLVLAIYSTQDIPISSKGYGFSVGDPLGNLHIQFFLDFQCPDSKESFEAWTMVRRLISLQQNRVKLTFQFNPLPYHFYATFIHQAFFYVLKNAGQTEAENFMTYVFGNQQKYAEQSHMDKTSTQFAKEFSEQIGKLFKVDPVALSKQLVIGSQSFKSLKNHWRYTTIEKGVAGAPMFYANGVRIDGAEQYSYLDWINFIKMYKSSSPITHKH